jgi:hypothetical protein
MLEAGFHHRGRHFRKPNAYPASLLSTDWDLPFKQILYAQHSMLANSG